jgi:adenylate cyclase
MDKAQDRVDALIRSADGIRPLVERSIHAILIVDMVESVRLIEEDEEGVLKRWLRLVEHVENHVLSEMQGHLVKSLGDGMLLDFSNVRSAISAAFAIQKESQRDNAGRPADQQILLRMGIALSKVLVGRHDIYGRGVNLAARLTSLAGPGEIIMSAEVRDQVTPVLDAEVEDLGDCYVKHIPQAVRAYRMGPPGPRPIIKATTGLAPLLPSIAVVPFAAREQGSDDCLLGEVLAEEIIRTLSRSRNMNVISRLSTTAFRGRQLSLEDIDQHLRVHYLLSGFYQTDGTNLALDLELADVKSQHVVWTDQLTDRVPAILGEERELIDQVVEKVANAILAHELERARSKPLPTVESYTLLMAAVALMHRMSPADFNEAQELLQAVIDRAPRHPIPQSWLANWYVLRVQQGWTEDPIKDEHLAMDCTKRALDADPHSSLALAINGLVHTHMSKRLDIAAERYAHAVQANPNHALAWLLKGTLHAFRDEGNEAVADTQRAIRLSPLDPHRYYYDTLAATAYLAARKYELAIQQAQRSLRANRLHTSTLRVLTIARWQLGLQREARETAAELMRLEPALTIKGYLQRTPSAGYRTGLEWSGALRQAGVPESRV